MKKLVFAFFAVVMLSGCTGKNTELARGVALRTGLLSAELVSFDVDVTADYGDSVQLFSMQCQADSHGTVRFSVTAPASISGIRGSVNGEEGTLEFDSTALYFPLLADEQLAPVSAPWLLMQALRNGCITSAGADGDMAIVSIDDRYDDDALHLDIWLNASDAPVKAEVVYRERKILSMDVKNFTSQ